MSYRELFKRSFVTCVTCVTCPCPALRSSVSCSTLWWLPTLPTSQQPQRPLKSDRWKEWSHVSCFCVFSTCFVATCCMSMHVIACLRRTPFGPLYICYCWSIRHLGMDPSLWKYALPHCSQFCHWIFWPCRDIETTRFWIWMFFPAIFVAVDRTSSFRETWEVEKLSCKFAARYLTQQYTICGIP